MEFDTDWLTLGKHRVRLHATRGFPSELAGCRGSCASGRRKQYEREGAAGRSHIPRPRRRL